MCGRNQHDTVKQLSFNKSNFFFPFFRVFSLPRSPLQNLQNVYTALWWLNVAIAQSPFSSVQFSRSVVSDSVIPWTAARQASLSITNCWSPPIPLSTDSVMPSIHLILCRPLLLLPSIFPSIRVFSNESALRIRWPKYWEVQLQHQSFQLEIS